MPHPVRWGIIGPGNIAHKFAAGLRAVDGATVAAVASRDPRRAAEFARTHQVARVHEDYAALAADPDIDAVYIATPHPFHAEPARRCLREGRAVLVEKPLTTSAATATELIECARASGVFLMEAMWTRFLPMMQQVRAWVTAGRIGEVRMLRASFGFRAGVDPASRLFSPALAGGGILDVGVYPLALARDLIPGEPSTIAASGHLGATGVDEQSAVLLGYPGGELALCDCAIRTAGPHDAQIRGTDGRIDIPTPFWAGTTAVLYDAGGAEVERFAQDHLENGYEYEAMAVAEALAAGWLEHPRAPHADTLAVLAIVDEARRQIGLRYPFEEERT